MRHSYLDYCEKPLGLKSKFGCGITLLGKPSLNDNAAFREEIIVDRSNSLNPSDTSEVQYRFFTLFYLPIFPLGCYRIQRIHRKSQEDRLYRSMGIYDTVEYKQLQCEEKPLGKEIAHIYLHYYGLLPIVIILLYFMLSGGEE